MLKKGALPTSVTKRIEKRKVELASRSRHRERRSGVDRRGSRNFRRPPERVERVGKGEEGGRDTQGETKSVPDTTQSTAPTARRPRRRRRSWWFHSFDARLGATERGQGPRGKDGPRSGGCGPTGAGDNAWVDPFCTRQDTTPPRWRDKENGHEGHGQRLSWGRGVEDLRLGTQAVSEGVEDRVESGAPGTRCGCGTGQGASHGPLAAPCRGLGLAQHSPRQKSDHFVHLTPKVKLDAASPPPRASTSSSRCLCHQQNEI